ncbi:MAG: antibiotic biosynthesis monooxygenase [Robiginitomaculum sp.]|nr:antibiotic biosynthesis monooxygenase [Robiginitomaculum sp.]
MKFNRRKVTTVLASLMAAPLISCDSTSSQEIEETNMYGLIAKITAIDGKRDALSSILIEGLREMPGNLSYIVANDAANANDLWITEVWVDQAAHQNSLSLSSVQKAIKVARPLMAGMVRIAETRPVGGEGL